MWLWSTRINLCWHCLVNPCPSCPFYKSYRPLGNYFFKKFTSSSPPAELVQPLYQLKVKITVGGQMPNIKQLFLCSINPIPLVWFSLNLPPRVTVQNKCLWLVYSMSPVKYVTLLSSCLACYSLLMDFLCSPKNFGGAYSRRVVRPSVRTYFPNSCPAHNFVIWSWILKHFHKNNHHIETTCRAHHLGHYLKGQGHSMTLQQNRVRPITSLLEVRFNNYFTEMITILNRRVTCNIWVVTLKVKVTAWPCSKIVSCP
jgi:hypothetical protein